jgi:hypothetical protein
VRRAGTWRIVRVRTGEGVHEDGDGEAEAERDVGHGGGLQTVQVEHDTLPAEAPRHKKRSVTAPLHACILFTQLPHQVCARVPHRNRDVEEEGGGHELSHHGTPEQGGPARSRWRGLSKYAERPEIQAGPRTGRSSRG